MDEVRRDYYDQIHEQNLIRHVGTTSKAQQPTEKQLQARNSPVKTVVYPELSSLAERIAYLRHGETPAAFCKRARIAPRTYEGLLKSGVSFGSTFLKKLAVCLGCSGDWLAKGKKDSLPVEQPPPIQWKAGPHFDTLSERLHWMCGDTTIAAFCRRVGIQQQVFYRCCRTGAKVETELIRQIAYYGEVSFDWLWEGCTEKRIASKKQKPPKKTDKIADTLKKQPERGISFQITGICSAEELIQSLSAFHGKMFSVHLELQEIKKMTDAGGKCGTDRTETGGAEASPQSD